MFPLSCARVRAHTGHEVSARKKTWSTYKFAVKNDFAHVSYMSFYIKMSAGEMLHTGNFLCTQTSKN